MYSASADCMGQGEYSKMSTRVLCIIVYYTDPYCNTVIAATDSQGWKKACRSPPGMLRGLKRTKRASQTTTTEARRNHASASLHVEGQSHYAVPCTLCIYATHLDVSILSPYDYQPLPRPLVMR